MTELYTSGVLRRKFLPGGDPTEPLFIVTATSWSTNHDAAKAALKPLETCPESLKKSAYQTIWNEEWSLTGEYANQLYVNVPTCEYNVNNRWLEGSHENIVKAVKPIFTQLPSSDSYTFSFPISRMAFSR